MGRKSNNNKDLVFGKSLDDHKSKEYDQIPFDDVYNPYTLNIFTDASYINGDACYGALVVNRDTILDQAYFCREHCSSSYEAEILAIRVGLIFALGYMHRFTTIRLYSDNKTAVNVIKKFNLYKPVPEYDENHNIISYRNYSDSSKAVISNDYLLNECMYMYRDLITNIDYTMFEMYFIPSHIYDDKRNLDNNSKLINSQEVNKSNSNKLDITISKSIDESRREYVDDNLMVSIAPTSVFLYLTRFNCIVDNTVRISLKEMQRRSKTHRCNLYSPIRFLPMGTPKSFFRRELN